MLQPSNQEREKPSIQDVSDGKHYVEISNQENKKIVVKPSKIWATSAYKANTMQEEKRESSLIATAEGVQDRIEMSNRNQELKVNSDQFADKSFKNTFQEQLTLHNRQKEEKVEDQVLQLKKDGYNVEEIAKKLKKGKTEIELLLKFHS